MGTLTLLSGTVSHNRTSSSTSGSIRTSHDGYVSGGVSTTHTTLFRVDGKSVSFEGVLNVADGDAVTLVGYDKGEFDPVVLRNDSTGLVYPVEDRGSLGRSYGFGMLILVVVVWALSSRSVCFMCGPLLVDLMGYGFDVCKWTLLPFGVVFLGVGFFYRSRVRSAVSMLPPMPSQKF
jgi:hypothetical protein